MKQKAFFLVSQVLSFRHTKRTSKNVPDTTFKDKNVSANILNKDLLLDSKWAYDWKMLFNPDRSKPAQDGVIFKKKASTKSPVLIMNNIQVEREYPIKTTTI